MLMLLFFACAGGDVPVPLVETRGSTAEAALLWNGFTQVWGYNHRLNALGDYVGPPACDGEACTAEIVHAAASGSGTDVADWISRYTAVRAPGAVLLGGTTRIAVDVEGGEGRALYRAAEAVIPDAQAFTGAHALLNGFELVATRDADKLAHLTVLVGEPVVSGDALSVPIDLELLLDCDSVECDGFFRLDHAVHYEVLVSWLVVGGPGVSVTPTSVEQAYAWTNAARTDELDLGDLVVAGEAVGVPGAGAAALAFTGLSVDLDDDHHMAEWASTALPGAYDPESGRMPFVANLGFKQWNAGTWANPLAYTEPGSAALRADLALLQLDDGCVTTGSVAGRTRWVADGAPADASAESARAVEIGGCP